MPDAITYTEHAQDVLAHAVSLDGMGQRFVLVTSIDIQGGAAREVGSLAIVEENGAMTGYMSNGCIDRDIQLQAKSLLQDGGAAKVLRYGEGSPFADLTLPCGGALELLFDPQPPANKLRAAYDALCQRQAATLSFTIPDSGAQADFTYDPKPRLALAGRGAVFRATVGVAKEAGFALKLYSPDEDDLIAIAHLTDSAPIRLTTPDTVSTLELDAYSAFLTLFHDHDWEPELLKAALKTDARYIGCLGSRRTQELRLLRLDALGVEADAAARIHGPVGLVPSLRQAPLIAVSAVAELTQHFPRCIHPTP